MRKTYILDTSTLITDPYSFKTFDHSDVIIPIAVLNELDNLKKQAGEAGRHARVCIRLLDEISKVGDISTGILLEENDVLLKIDATYYDPRAENFQGFGDPTYGDTQILICLYVNWQLHPENDVTLVSNDINLRIKAKARAIDAVGYETDKLSVTELYPGMQVANNEDAGLAMQAHGFINPNDFGLILQPNECVLFQGADGNGLALGRKVASDKIKLIRKNCPWGISSKNKEQAFAMDLLMDPRVDLVTLTGKAGTGKSLIVLASALELVINKKMYERFVIYRPIQAVGNDIGFLPGTMEEKLAPWFQAIMDNFEYLLSSKPGSGDWRKDLEMFQKKGRIEMEAITYIRGRSIPNSIILIDECQNLSKEDVKTILTRAGENTKIILTGDIEQIDNSGLDAMSNGLTHAIEKFKGSDVAGHITLTQGERSRLASLAADIL
jgi:PhoH-like ATPase